MWMYYLVYNGNNQNHDAKKSSPSNAYLAMHDAPVKKKHVQMHIWTEFSNYFDGLNYTANYALFRNGWRPPLSFFKPAPFFKSIVYQNEAVRWMHWTTVAIYELGERQLRTISNAIAKSELLLRRSSSLLRLLSFFDRAQLLHCRFSLIRKQSCATRWCYFLNSQFRLSDGSQLPHIVSTI